MKTARVPAPVLLCLPLVLFLAVLFLAPTVTFLAQAFKDQNGGLTLVHLDRLLASGTYTDVIVSSFRISFWVTLVTIAVAYPVAYVLATADRSRRSYWALFVLLPFWSSFLVRTFAMILLLGRNGPINNVLLAYGLADRPQALLYNGGAVIVGMTNVLTPFAILTMLGVLESIDLNLVRAAGTLGARPVQAFFRIYLPMSMPGVTAAVLLVFITALGFLITPALLGSPRDTMIAQLILQQVQDLTDWSFAALLCIVVLVTALAAFILFDRVVGLTTLAGQQSRTGRRQGNAHLRRAALKLLAWTGDALARASSALGLRPRRCSPVAAVLVLVFLGAPLLLLVPLSFSTASFVSWPPRGFTMRWYAELLGSEAWLEAIARSLWVAFLTAALCFVIAVPAAFGLKRLSGLSASALFALVLSPMIVPRIVTAIALFYVYAAFGVVGSTAGLVIGHTIIALPYFFIAVIAVLKTYDSRLDAAAATLGASPWRTVHRVTLPVIGMGLISAALFAFVISFDELNVALFSSGGLSPTLPKMMWDAATMGFSPVLAAVSTLVLVTMSGLALLALRLRPN